MEFQRYIRPIVVVIILLFGCQPLHAQSSIFAKSMGLGGAGTALVTGVESIFHNPANLQFVDTSSSIQISFGAAAARFDPVLSQSSPQKQWRHFKSYFDIYKGGSSAPINSPANQLLNRLYPENLAVNSYSGQFELRPMAFSLHNNNYSLSLAFRTRTASSFTIGKGWYSHQPVTLENGQNVIDRELHQRFQHFNEIQLSYAQPLSYLNGLTPSLGRFYVGIAPKFLFGGTYLDAKYDVQYYKAGQSDFNRIQSFYHYSSGSFTKVAEEMSLDNPVLPAVRQYVDRSSLTKSSGYGVGIDFGLTYVHPLNSSFQLQHDGTQMVQPGQKALRVSFTLSDIGYFHHKRSPAVYRLSADTVSNQNPDQLPLTSQVYTGSPGQFYNMIERYGKMDNVYQSATKNTSSFRQLLPGIMKGGMAIIYRNFSIAADFHASIEKNMFHGTNLGFHSGMEYYLLPGWPLRAGINIRNNKTSLISFGTGIETDSWSFNTGVQFTSISEGINFNIYGAALASFRLSL